MTMTITLDRGEVSVILAALRYWQRIPSDEEIPVDITDIWYDGGTIIPMSDSGVDELCERINCGGDEPLTEFEEVCLKELEEEAKLKKGEYLVSYEVTEQVAYSRSFKIDGAVLVEEDELRDMVEEDWVENGDANKDIVSVDERDYDGVWVTDRDGKCLSAEVFFESRL